MPQPAFEAGPTDTPLLDETIAANLARTVAAHGHNEAIVSCHQGLRWTYADFHARVRKLAEGLKKLIDDGLEWAISVDEDPVALRRDVFERATAAAMVYLAPPPPAAE